MEKNKYNVKTYNHWLSNHFKETFINKELLSIILIIITLNFDLKVIGVCTVILYTVLFLLDYKKKNQVKINTQFIIRLIILIILYVALNIWFIIDYISYHYADIVFDNTAVYYIILIAASYFSYLIMWVVNVIAIPFDKLVKSIGGKHAKSKLKKSKTR